MPECLDPQGICSFRVDIDSSTCGSISPQIREQFDCTDNNNFPALTFQSKLRRRDLNTSSYFRSPQNVPTAIKEAKMAMINQEIDSIARGRS